MQLTNQSLRPTAFGIHKSLGLSTGLFCSVAGHASRRTHLVYTRKNVELLSEIAGNFQEAVTGVPAERPRMDLIEVVHRLTGKRELRRVKDFLPLVVDNEQVGVFPLSGLLVDEIAEGNANLTVIDEEDKFGVIYVEDDSDDDEEDED